MNLLKGKLVGVLRSFSLSFLYFSIWNVNVTILVHEIKITQVTSQKERPSVHDTVKLNTSIEILGRGTKNWSLI